MVTIRKAWVAGTAATLLAGLVACAPNPTPYQAASGSRGYGYGEQQIEQNRFRVFFAGNADTSRQAVETYLLYRAAELTRAQGYDHFLMVTQDVEANTRYRTTYDDFGAYGFYHFGHFHPGDGVGMGASFGTSYPITRYSAFADIVMMKGPKEPGDVRAFSAADVMAKLQPMLH